MCGECDDDVPPAMPAMELGNVINYSFGALAILLAGVRLKNRSGDSGGEKSFAKSGDAASKYRQVK